MKGTSIGRKNDKDTFLCKIAGLVYEIGYRYPYTKVKFRDYIIESAEDNQEIISITYNERDLDDTAKILREVALGASYESDGKVAEPYAEEIMQENASGNSREPSEEYKEYACIFDKIATPLPKRDMLLMHGALIEYEGEGFIFTAPSGTGKTTHILLWKKYLGEAVSIINGDKPELLIKEDEVMAYGTPWCGKEGWQINKSVPLKGICLLRRGNKNRIKKISPGEYIEFFIKQFYFDFQSEYTLKVFDLFSKIAERVNFYLLECDISEEAAQTSFEQMTGKEWRKRNEG